MPEPLSPAVTMRKLPLGLLLGWVLIAGTAQAQVARVALLDLDRIAMGGAHVHGRGRRHHHEFDPVVARGDAADDRQAQAEGAQLVIGPLVKQELEINHQLSERLIQATESGNSLVQQNIKVKNWLERALQSERNIKEQIAVLKGSLLLSRILYQQQQTQQQLDFVSMQQLLDFVAYSHLAN